MSSTRALTGSGPRTDRGPLAHVTDRAKGPPSPIAESPPQDSRFGIDPKRESGSSTSPTHVTLEHRQSAKIFCDNNTTSHNVRTSQRRRRSGRLRGRRERGSSKSVRSPPEGVAPVPNASFSCDYDELGRNVKIENLDASRGGRAATACRPSKRPRCTSSACRGRWLRRTGGRSGR